MPLIYPQASGEAGIIQTVNMMIQFANESFLHPWMRERAFRETEQCESDINCQHQTLTEWTQRAITYFADPADTEALHHPVLWVERRILYGNVAYGDCDDMAMYLATLLKSAGHNPEYVIVSSDGVNFHHVLVRCHGEFLDPTLGYGIELSPTPKRAKAFKI